MADTSPLDSPVTLVNSQDTNNLLNLIVEGANDSLMTNSKSMGQIMENLGVMESLAGTIQEAREQQATDITVIESTKTAAELNAQKYRIKAANAAGIDPTKASDFMVETIGKLQQSQKKVQDKYQDYAKVKNINLFTDPVGFVTEVLSGSRMKKFDELQDGINEANLYQQQLQATTGLMDSVTRTSEQTKESITSASAEAMSRKAATDATINAQLAAMDKLKYNSQRMTAAMSLSKENMEVLYNVRNAQVTAQNQALALASFRAADEDRDLTREMRREQLKTKMDEKQLDDYTAEMITLGMQARGMDTSKLTPAALASKVALFKRGSPEILDDYHNGERYTATGVPSLGSSPSKALDLIRERPVNLAPARDKFISKIQEAEQAYAADPKMAGNKDKKVKEQYIDNWVQKEITRYSNLPITADNPLSFGDLKQFLELTNIANKKITKEILAPAAAAGVTLEDPNKVLQLGASAVKAGKLTSSQFTSELSDIYRQANLIHIEAANPMGLGIEVPHAGRRYLVKSPGMGVFDMTNPTELGRYLAVTLAASMKLSAPNMSMQPKVDTQDVFMRGSK